MTNDENLSKVYRILRLIKYGNYFVTGAFGWFSFF